MEESKKKPAVEKKAPKLNIYQKMIEVRKSCEFLQKSATGFKYKYVTESQIIFAVKKAFDEQGLFMQVGMMPTEEGKMCVSIVVINSDNPDSFIEEKFYYNVTDTDPRITGSLLTYTVRYFLLKNLMIATDEADLDTVQKKNLAAQTTTKALLSAEQAASIVSLCEGRPDVMEQVTKHAPGGKLHNLTADRYQGIVAFIMKSLEKEVE